MLKNKDQLDGCVNNKKTVNRAVIALLLFLILAINCYQYLRCTRLEDDVEEMKAEYHARLVMLESKVAKRDKADPLQAKECRVVGNQGESKRTPCYVEFHRLYEAPHQFDGKWIRIVGYWSGGFERSALIPTPENKMYMSVNNEKASDWTEYAVYEKSLWVNFLMNSKIPTDNVISRKQYVFIGKFHRGPGGHMDKYFGELDEAQIISSLN